MTPRTYFSAGLLILALGALPESTAAAERASKPNVIVFLVDDMGWMDCGAYGSKYYQTPNIDRFAQRAMRFTDAYAQPLCSPTRACLLSGKAAARHGITTASGHQAPQPPGHVFLPERAPPNRPIVTPESKNYLEPSEYTLAEALRDAGWRTAHVGKWHLGLTEPYWPEKQGFDVAVHAHPDPGPPSYFSPYGFRQFQSYADGPPGEYITDRLTDEAVKFIEASRDRPFFLNLWHHGVHGPWGHKEEYTRAFHNQTDPRGQQGNPIMASMLKSIDESLGRILDTLDRLQLADNTIVIFNSDNGGNTHSNTPEDAKSKRRADTPQLADWRRWAGDRPPTNNSPLRDGKGTLYEGGVRVPLMWSWPGVIKSGSVSHEVVGAIDLYPTVLALLGLQRAPQQVMDGISYAEVLGSSGKLNRAAYFNFFPHGGPSKPPGVTVRAGDWKLIRWYETGPEHPSLRELYNLRDDLGEQKNLAEQMPERVKELDALIDAYLADTGALVPKPNPDFKPVAPAASKTAVPKPADPLQGLVPKACKATVTDGVLRVEADGRAPFLACLQIKHTGPAVLKLRARSAAGGPGKVQWRTEDQESFPTTGQTVSFDLKPSDAWQDVRVDLPVEGRLVHFRLYLPADKSPVELSSIEYLAAKTSQPVRTWSFRPSK